jgi:hypothetical protein
MIATRALIKMGQSAVLFRTWTWTWTPHRRMSFINTSLLRATKRHPFTTRRFFSAVNTHEAFLLSLRSHPGVTTLSLNRPHAKNAISLQLLKVRVHHFYYISQSPPREYPAHNVGQLNPAIHRLLGHRTLRRLRPRPHPKLLHPGLILLRCRLGRTPHHDQGPGIQVPH